jgi:diguanylate cyclase (GGDEF)-like protein
VPASPAVDHFKQINDTFGHVVGDRVLRFVASTLKDTITGKDIAARYGGEEFAVIMPRTPLRAAVDVAEQLRVAVKKAELVRRSTGEKQSCLTISIGVAALHARTSPQALIEAADVCLYAAKRSAAIASSASGTSGCSPRWRADGRPRSRVRAERAPRSTRLGTLMRARARAGTQGRVAVLATPRFLRWVPGLASLARDTRSLLARRLLRPRQLLHQPVKERLAVEQRVDGDALVAPVHAVVAGIAEQA